MSDTESSTDDPGTDEQYGTFTTEEGETIFYDRTNSAAWIQSDYVVDVGSAGQLPSE